MWPFKTNSRGFFVKPRYRLMQSYMFPGRYYLWDRKTRETGEYFDSLEEAMVYIHIENIDCEEVKMFKQMSLGSGITPQWVLELEYKIKTLSPIDLFDYLKSNEAIKLIPERIRAIQIQKILDSLP